jgi:nucleotide-binding universal stress UspA family protein
VVASPAEIRLKSVLVPTDFSATSQKALRHAVAIARHYGAKVNLAHVVSSLAITVAGRGAMKVAIEAARRDARQLENELLECGALKDLRYEVMVRRGEVWGELDKVIRQEKVDLLVIGTRGRRGVRKVLLGSVAEQIFHRAACPVLTVGPSAYQESRVDTILPTTTYLFPTDFDEASLRALPHAISFANHVPAKLVLLHVVRTRRVRDSFLGRATLRQLQELTLGVGLKINPEFVVEFGPAGPVSEKILQTATKLKVDLIIMGLRRFTHANVASHRPWATAYEVVCGAGCPVVTIRK